MQKLKFRVALKSLKINVVSLDKDTILSLTVDTSDTAPGDISELAALQSGINYIMELIKE